MTQPVRCPNCHSGNCGTYIRLSGMPVLQNCIIPNLEEAREHPKGDIHVSVCGDCGQIFNSAFQPELVVYNAHYDNSQQHSQTFIRHLDDVENMIAESMDLRRANVLEVGCGKGTFIKRIAKRYGCPCYGFDPSYIEQDPEPEPMENLQLYKEYFPPEESHGMPLFDLIIIRHVIEHLQSPMRMLKMLHDHLSPDGRIYVETPDLHWIIENNLLFDLTFEHCSYFTSQSMGKLLSLCAMHIRRCDTRFAGQYLCVLAQRDPDTPLAAGMREFEEGKNKYIDAFRLLAEGKSKRGRIALWGAAGKGVMFCNIFDPQAQLIDSVIDINISKQGAYIPGTGHPIIGPSSITQRDIRYIIVMNRNYIKEIQQMVQQIDATIEILSAENLLSPFE